MKLLLICCALVALSADSSADSANDSPQLRSLKEKLAEKLDDEEFTGWLARVSGVGLLKTFAENSWEQRDYPTPIFPNIEDPLELNDTALVIPYVDEATIVYGNFSSCSATLEGLSGAGYRLRVGLFRPESLVVLELYATIPELILQGLQWTDLVLLIAGLPPNLVHGSGGFALDLERTVLYIKVLVTPGLDGTITVTRFDFDLAFERLGVKVVQLQVNGADIPAETIDLLGPILKGVFDTAVDGINNTLSTLVPTVLNRVLEPCSWFDFLEGNFSCLTGYRLTELLDSELDGISLFGPIEDELMSQCMDGEPFPPTTTPEPATTVTDGPSATDPTDSTDPAGSPGTDSTDPAGSSGTDSTDPAGSSGTDPSVTDPTSTDSARALEPRIWQLISVLVAVFCLL